MDEISNSIFGFDYKKLKSNMKEIKRDIGKINKKIKHNLKKWLVSDLITNQKISDSNIRQINKWTKDMSQALYCTNKQIELLELQLFTAICSLGIIAMVNRIKAHEVKSNEDTPEKKKFEEAINTMDSYFTGELQTLSNEIGKKILEKRKNRI